MKNKMKVLAAGLCLAAFGLGATLGGYQKDTQAAAGSNLVMVDYGIYFNIMRDPDTNVEYIVYKGDKRGGITVRYNEDGEVYIYKEKSK